MSDKTAHVATVTSYVVSGSTAAAGAMTLNDIALLIGITATVLTFVANIVYKHLHYQLEKNKNSHQ